MSESTTTFDEAFDPATEEGTQPRSLLPAGKYRAEVTDASVTETKNGKGTMLNLTWIIRTPGQSEGRYVFQSILVRHESAEAQRYGRQKLKDLCVACGITEAVTDVTVFFNKPCMITVGIERDKEGIYNDKNKVGRILPAQTVTMPPPSPFTAQTSSSKPVGEEMNDKIPF